MSSNAALTRLCVIQVKAQQYKQSTQHTPDCYEDPYRTTIQSIWEIGVISLTSLSYGNV